MIAEIVEDLERSARKILICTSDGLVLRLTIYKPIHYWARTPSGKILYGTDAEGLHQILDILGSIKKSELARIEDALRQLADLAIPDLVTEILSDEDGIVAFLTYVDEYGPQFVETDDIAAFVIEYTEVIATHQIPFENGM